MTNIVVVTNQKGGIGKTFISTALAYLLSTDSHERGRAEHVRKAERVLLVDTDSQADASFVLTRNGIDAFAERNLFAALNEQDATDHIHVVSDTLHVLPASDKLALFDDLFMAAKAQLDHPEKLLADTLRPVAHLYDWIIIDTPPALSRLQTQALAVNFDDGGFTNIIIPLQTKRLGRDSIGKYAVTLNEVKNNINPYLHILGVLPVLTDTHARIDKKVLDSAKEMYGELIMDTIIRRKVSLEDMVDNGFSEHYASEREALEDFYNVLKEVRTRVEQQLVK